MSPFPPKCYYHFYFEWILEEQDIKYRSGSTHGTANYYFAIKITNPGLLKPDVSEKLDLGSEYKYPRYGDY